jgi:hypothetical protein
MNERIAKNPPEVLLVVVPEVEQHDHEQEEHHDRASVDDDLDRGEEVRFEQDEGAGQAGERRHHEEEAPDRALREHDA